MSCADVCLGGYDCDGSFDFCDIRTVKARKPFRCEECRRMFAPGTPYQRLVGKFDGDFISAKTCEVCAEIASAYSCGDGAIPLGGLWTDIYDVMFANGFNTGCLEKLETAAAKAFMLEQWRRWKGLVPEPSIGISAQGVSA